MKSRHFLATRHHRTYYNLRRAQIHFRSSPAGQRAEENISKISVHPFNLPLPIPLLSVSPKQKGRERERSNLAIAELKEANFLLVGLSFYFFSCMIFLYRCHLFMGLFFFSSFGPSFRPILFFVAGKSLKSSLLLRAL